jgi:hypothetical protein
MKNIGGMGVSPVQKQPKSVLRAKHGGHRPPYENFSKQKNGATNCSLLTDKGSL